MEVFGSVLKKLFKDSRADLLINISTHFSFTLKMLLTYLIKVQEELEEAPPLKMKER